MIHIAVVPCGTPMRVSAASEGHAPDHMSVDCGKYNLDHSMYECMNMYTYVYIHMYTYVYVHKVNAVIHRIQSLEKRTTLMITRTEDDQ